MRSLVEALSWWPIVERLASLANLRDILKNPRDVFIHEGLRSVCWKAFLLFEDVDRSRWPAKLQRSRDAYSSLRSVFLRAIDNPDELDDPLSENDNSPWNSLRKDEELRKEIFQDVDRCMPDNLYFRQPSTQNALLDILFVWSKLNSDISYRQGMHEILAPILWVVERDAIDPTSIRAPAISPNQKLMKDVLDAKFIAHDSFTLFSLVMQNARSSYQPQGAPNTSSISAPAESPIVSRSKRIIETLLVKTDPALASHLMSMDIIPQLFLMRWARLLFGREFSFDQVLTMWDRMFAEDPSSECVDHICLAMILRIRWKLIDCDNNSALSLLLHYPEPAEDQPPYTFVDDALYLKTHLNPEGGHYLVFKYTSRSIPLATRPDTPSSPSKSYSSLSKPGKLIRQSGGFDKLLQDAAREVYSRGEKWGLNQAVRDTMGEVRKNIQGLQRTSSQSHSHIAAADDTDQSSATQLISRINALTERNKALAKMLDGAVNELWQRQKDVSKGGIAQEQSDEKLTMAVAKVQLVQVYLEDSSLPLPAEETPSIPGSEPEFEADTALAETGEVLFDQDLHQKGSTEEGVALDQVQSDLLDRQDSEISTTKLNTPSQTGSHGVNETSVQSPLQYHNSNSEKSSRPQLTQSSFSWILGQESTHTSSPRSAFLNSASPFTMPARQHSPSRRAAARTSAAFLFGDSEDGESLVGRPRKGSMGSRGMDKAKEKSREKGKMWQDEEMEADEVYRLGTLKWK